MKKSRIWNIAVVWHPTEAQHKDGKRSEIVVKPQAILAVDESAATLIAAKKIGDEYAEQMDQLEVAVAPF